MNPTDPAVKNLLSSAQKAAEELRKEQGFWVRLMNWLEVRSERKHDLRLQKMESEELETRLARCRENKHDYQDWKPLNLTSVYAEGADPQKSLPIHRIRSWQGNCITCGCPHVITKKV